MAVAGARSYSHVASALLFGLGPGSLADAGSDSCPWEPLLVVAAGSHPAFKRVTGSSGDSHVTCAEFTNGACNYSVPFPGLDCLVNCVAREEDCSRLNPRTVGVDRLVAPSECVRCPIAACASCAYQASGPVRCRRCLDDFIGVGEEGQFEVCNLRHRKYLDDLLAFLFGVIFCCVLTISVTVSLGAFREFRPVFKKLRHFHLSGWNAKHFIRELHASRQSVRFRLPAEEAEVTDASDCNYQAIRQGLFYSLTSSIKFSSLRQEEHALTSDAEMRSRSSLLAHLFLDVDTTRQVGLGLQLLFRSQLFFLGVASILWLFSMANGKHHATFQEITDLATSCTPDTDEMIRRQQLMLEAKLFYASVLQGRCLSLWVVLLLLTFAFHVCQRHFINLYDQRTLTAQDYALKIVGLPPSMTSEMRLMQILERELRMEGKLHGVSICYDIRGLQDAGVEPARIESMVENIVEADDLANSWCTEALSRPVAELQEALQRDGEELRGLLIDQKLKSSGVAYIVFKKQRYMHEVLQLHKGIEVTAFHEEPVANKRSLYKPRIHTESLKSIQAFLDSYIADMARLRYSGSEPSGLRWFHFKKDRKLFMRHLITMTLRILTYLGFYFAFVHLFYVTMVNPWQDNFIEGRQSSYASVLTGRMVLLGNFGIQTLVMHEAEHVGFLRTASVDTGILIWATILFLLTNGYIITQECLRPGIRWSLVPPPGASQRSEKWWHWQRTAVQSTLVEQSVGDNLIGVMLEQIGWLYVLGEVANILLPITRNWVALRVLYGHYLGGGGVVTRLCRAVLPRCRSTETVTAREAEKAQLLMPLLLWMEYTYIVVFTGMALATFFFITDRSSTICGWLILFGFLFYTWQRHIIVWLYAPATYDSALSYKAFIRIWGNVLSIPPSASVWWAYRRGVIREASYTYLMMVIVYVLTYMIYYYGLMFINSITQERTGMDDFTNGSDPGYSEVMEEHGSSWWNVNPVYVLKNRHCPDLPGHEVHTDVQCWPKHQERQGFFELGKEFRHEKRSAWMRRHGKSNVQQIMERFSPEEHHMAGAMLFRTAYEAFGQQGLGGT